MKKLLLVCCLLVGFSAVSRAQRQTSTPVQSATALRNELNLNDEQTSKAVAIYTEQNAAMAAAAPATPPAAAPGAPGAAAGAGRGAGGRGGARNPIMEATNAKLKAILTPEQALTFQYYQDLQRAAAGGFGGN